METLSNRLTDAQRAAYDDTGFIAIRDVFSRAEVAELSVTVSASFDRAEDDLRTLHLLELTAKHERFLQLARDPRIVERIRPLLGNCIQLQHSKLASKARSPDHGPFGWHQDFAYFPHTNTDLLAVMILLDDTDRDNGCLNVLSGSHRLGLLPHGDGAGVFTGRCQEPWRWERHPERIVPLELPAGSITIHHALTLHGSQANVSGRRRWALVFEYRAADAHQLADRVFSDTGTPILGTWSGDVRCELASYRLPYRAEWSNPFGDAWHQRGSAVTPDPKIPFSHEVTQ